MSESLSEYLVEEEVLETNEGYLSFCLSLLPIKLPTWGVVVGVEYPNW